MPRLGMDDTSPAVARSRWRSVCSVGMRNAAPLMKTFAHSVAVNAITSIDHRRIVPMVSTDMPETHPPLVPEPPAPDTARRPLAEEKPESEKVDRRTAVWHAVQRPFQAFDRPRIRETAISAMIVVILAIGVVSNLPDAAITRAVYPLLRPVAIASGLDQNWSMFAPTPPQRLEYLEVHVRMANGADKVWTVPRRNRIMGVAFSHRWRKFKEALMTNAEIRPDFAHWVVSQLSGPGDHPVHGLRLPGRYLISIRRHFSRERRQGGTTGG